MNGNPMTLESVFLSSKGLGQKDIYGAGFASHVAENRPSLAMIISYLNCQNPVLLYLTPLLTSFTTLDKSFHLVT